MMAIIQAPYTKSQKGYSVEKRDAFFYYPPDHIVGEQENAKKYATAVIPIENTFSRKPLKHFHNYNNEIP